MSHWLLELGDKGDLLDCGYLHLPEHGQARHVTRGSLSFLFDLGRTCGSSPAVQGASPFLVVCNHQALDDFS